LVVWISVVGSERNSAAIVFWVDMPPRDERLGECRIFIRTIKCKILINAVQISVIVITLHSKPVIHDPWQPIFATCKDFLKQRFQNGIKAVDL
jgi:hypothetical protein